MNEKLNTQNLIELFAQKHGVDKKLAEIFVKQFFLLIEKSLVDDKYVKIRGLGTFKIVDVENRESVNINTGKRFEIRGHTKVSFTPELALKELINKPFSYFETVVLNEETVLGDIPLENEKTEEKEENFVEQSGKTPIISEPIVQQEDLVEEKVGNLSNNSIMKYFIWIMVFMLLACIGIVVSLCFPDLLDKTPFDSKQQTEEKSDEEIKKPESFKAIMSNHDKENTITKVIIPINTDESPKNSIVTSKKENINPAAIEPDSINYKIVGTKTTYTIGEGETLTRVALRFYGTKALWPYIMKYNPTIIKNPNHVLYGTVIKIPELVKK